MSWWDGFTDFVRGVATQYTPITGVIADTSAAVDAARGVAPYSGPGTGTAANLSAPTIVAEPMYERINQAVSYLAAAAPGGPQSLTWDQANEVPAGQAVMSAVASSALTPQGQVWGMTPDQFKPGVTRAFLNTPFAGAAPGIDLTSEVQRQKAYEDSLGGRVASGLTDFTLSWYTDPLVVGGKALKVAREGSTFLTKFDKTADFMGTTNRTLLTPRHRVVAAREIDDHMLWLQTNGTQGKQTALGKFVEDSLAMDSAQLMNEPIVANSASRDFMAGVLGQNTDPAVAAAFVKASFGSVAGRNELGRMSVALKDALDRQRQLVDVFERDLMNMPLGFGKTEHYYQQTAERLDYGKALIADYRKQDRALDAALTALDKHGTMGSVTRIGARSLKGRAREAKWAEWKSNMTYGEINPDGPIRIHTFQNNWWDQPVHVLDWVPETLSAVQRAGEKAVRGLTRQKPNGYVTINGLDAQNASDEILAIVNDVPAVKGDAAFKRQIVNEFLATAGRSADQRLQAVHRLEERIVERLAAQHGVAPEQALEIARNYQQARAAVIDGVRSQGMYVNADDKLVASALLQSQLANKVPMMDFHLIDTVLTRHHSAFKSATGPAKDAFVAAADSLNSLWKATVLLRGGYAPRNILEGQLRILATYGWIPMFEDFPGTMKRSIRNWNLRFTEGKSRAADFANRRNPAVLRNQMRLADDGVGYWQNQRRLAERELAKIEAQNKRLVAQHKARWKKLTDSLDDNQTSIMESLHPASAGEPALHSTLGARADLERIDRTIRELTNRRNTVQAQLDAIMERRLASKEARKAGKLGTGKGHAFNPDDPFAQVARSVSSAGVTYEELFGNVAEPMVGYATKHGAWAKIQPGDTGYWHALEAASNQLVHDPLANQFLHGRSLNDAIDWARSAEARAWRKEFHLRNDQQVAEHAARVKQMVHQYLPDEALRMELAATGRLSQRTLKKTLQDYEVLSAIHGEKLVGAKPVVDVLSMVKRGQEVGYKWIGTLPEDALLRHPFYDRLYRMRKADLENVFKSQGEEVLWDPVSGVAVNAAADRITRAAHSFALLETKRVLFTLDRYGNVSSKLRWLSPFFAAQSNTIRTWGKIVYRDPSVAARASIIWNAPNRSGMVVDSQGNPIGDEGPLGLLGGQGMVKVPGSVGQMDMLIPKAGINVAFQGGSPLLPSLGPAPQVPVQMLVANQPNLENTIKDTLGKWLPEDMVRQVYETAVPFGTPESDWTDLFTPAWVKRAKTLLGPDNAPEFNATVNQIYRNNLQDWEAGGRVGKKPTPADAVWQTRLYYGFRMAVNMSAPVSPRFQPKDQFYVDQYRAMTEKYGFEQGESMFLDKYPEFFRVTQSSQRNTTGMRSSQRAYEAQQANQQLFQDIVGMDPKLGWMVTNPDGAAEEFSPAVREWQKGTSIAPGAGDTFYETQSPQEFEANVQRERGWREYTKQRAVVDDLLAQRGLQSMSDPGAEDIRNAWRAWLNDYKSDPQNADWATDYDTSEAQANTRKRITALTMLVSDPGYRASMEARGLGGMVPAMEDYLANRQFVVDELARRAAAGGASTLEAQANSDLAAAWDKYTQSLRYSSTGWAWFFDRALSRDTMTEVPV